MGLQVGDAIRITGSTFRIVGIYETGNGFEDRAAVVPLREAQTLALQPHRVSMLYVKLSDPDKADQLQARVERRFPDLAVSTSSGFINQEQLLEVLQEMVGQISFLAIFIGGVGILNTMLMSVLERTGEIGVLRALGWRRRRVLGMILQESLILGAVGGVCGIFLGFGLGSLIGLMPGMFGAMKPLYTPQLLVQAVMVAAVAGVVGGLYPAWRATRMRPVEALRYE
jgi:putative ABC transport system permease protein